MEEEEGETVEQVWKRRRPGSMLQKRSSAPDLILVTSVTSSHATQLKLKGSR